MSQQRAPQGYGPVDNIDFDSLPAQHQKKLMEDVGLYENSQAMGTSGRQQLMYQYANLSKNKGRNPLTKMQSPAQGPVFTRNVNGVANPTPPPPVAPGRSAPPTFSSKLEQRWGKNPDMMDMPEPVAQEEEDFDAAPYYYERTNATQLLSPRNITRQRHLPDPNLTAPRRSHERSHAGQVSKSQEREYFMQQQQQRQRQQQMDPFQQQYRQQQQQSNLHQRQQQQQRSMERPPKGNSRSQMRSTQIRREDFTEGRRAPQRQNHQLPPQSAHQPHLPSPRRNRVQATPTYDSEEEVAPVARRREEASPKRAVEAEQPGGTANMYKNFEQSMDDRYQSLRREFDENLTNATINVNKKKVTEEVEIPEETPLQILDSESKSILKYTSGYNYKTRKAPKHIYPLEPHNGSESTDMATPPPVDHRAPKKKSRFLREKRRSQSSGTRGQDSEGQDSDDEDSMIGRGLIKRPDPDGGEEKDFLGDTSVTENLSKIDSLIQKHKREALSESNKPYVKRKPLADSHAEAELMLMYAEQDAGVENVDSIKQRAEMDGKDMEVRIVAGEVVVMTVEEAGIFDEKNEMEKKLSRKIMLLADDDDSDDEAATKKVRAIEMEMRKKMRGEIEKRREQEEEEQPRKKIIDEEEDEDELLEEEQRFLEAKIKMKETQKILEALEKATEDVEDSEDDDDRRKRIERKANESILKKKTENMRVLDFLKAGESNSVASEMITEKEELKKRKAMKKEEQERLIKEEVERKLKEEEDRKKKEEEKRREEEERIKREEEERIKKEEEEERMKKEEEERVRKEEEERKRKEEEERLRKEEEERLKREEEERIKREQEEKRRREEEERKRRKEEEKKRREEEARREAERIKAEKEQLKREMEFLQEKMRIVEEEERDKMKMKEMLELGNVDEASFVEEKLKAIAEEKKQKKLEEERIARLSEDEKFEAKRRAQDEQFQRSEEESRSQKAKQRESLRVQLEEEKARNIEREVQHQEEMKLLQAEVMQKSMTSSTGGTIDVTNKSVTNFKTMDQEDETTARDKRNKEERLMLQQDCFQMTDSFTEQLFAVEEKKTSPPPAKSLMADDDMNSDEEDEELRKMEVEHDRKKKEAEAKRKANEADFFNQMLDEEQKWLEEKETPKVTEEALRRRKALEESERLIKEAEELSKELEDVDFDESIEKKIERRATEESKKIIEEEEDRRQRGKSPKRGVPGMPKFSSLPKIKEVKEILATLSSGSEDEEEDTKKQTTNAGEKNLPFSSIFAPPPEGNSPPRKLSPTMTIKGDVSVKDEKGQEINRLEDGEEMQVENERTILIKNAKGINIVKISKGDTWIKNHGIEEKVSVGNNRVTICNADGVQMVEVKDGEIGVQDFDGEVIVKNMEMVKGQV